MRIARVCGIEFRVSPFFLLLLLAYASVGLFRETVLVFWVVLLHELAHVAAAASIGVRAERVELLPFGGVASFASPLAADPASEAIIAAAGPAHNFAFAFVAAVLGRNGHIADSFARFLVETNVAIGLFNLLPGIPLDGGRILRAALASRMGPVKATWVAAALGRAFGLGILLAGCVLAYLGRCNVIVPILGGFLVFAASREVRAVSWARMRDILGKKEQFLTTGAMTVHLLAAREKVALGDVARLFTPGKLNVVVVLDREFVARGLATEMDVLEAMTRYGPDAPVEISVV